MFSELEKKWIILQLAETPPSTVHREFMLHLKISGRTAKSYQLIQFTRVLNHFNETGSIHKKKTYENQTKKNRSSDSGSEEFFEETPSCSQIKILEISAKQMIGIRLR